MTLIRGRKNVDIKQREGCERSGRTLTLFRGRMSEVRKNIDIKQRGGCQRSGGTLILSIGGCQKSG